MQTTFMEAGTAFVMIILGVLPYILLPLFFFHKCPRHISMALSKKWMFLLCEFSLKEYRCSRLRGDE